MSIQALKINPSMLVSVENEQITTTSLQVSDAFSKRHDNVIRSIENLDIPEEFAKLNFAVCFKNNELQNGKPQKYYRMTKDGFVFLAMGFTGKRAAQFKVAYINAFNEMAEQLQQTEQETIAKLKAKVSELDESSKRLTPEQAGHIQKAVNTIWKTQGIPFQTTYHNIKVKFGVDTYKHVMRDDYPALCRFLNIDPKFKTKKSPGQDEVENLLRFTAERIRLVDNLEVSFGELVETLSSATAAAKKVEAELKEARYRTTDLTFYLLHAANRISH